MMVRPEIGVLIPDGEDSSDWASAVNYGGGKPELIHEGDDLPQSVQGLLVGGTQQFKIDLHFSLINALRQKLPVLGIHNGMHVLNRSLGGTRETPVNQDEPKIKQSVFLAPGGKLSFIIAGSGWVSVPFSNKTGIRYSQLSPELFASSYREDGFLVGIEMPGRRWVMGIQWDAQKFKEMPKGFDSLLMAFCEEAEKYT